MLTSPPSSEQAFFARSASGADGEVAVRKHTRLALLDERYDAATASNCLRLSAIAVAQQTIRVKPRFMRGNSRGCHAVVITRHSMTLKPASKRTLANSLGVQVAKW